MPRQILDPVTREWVSHEEYYARRAARDPSRKAPAVITDEIPPTIHHGSGRTFTSKAKFREETKRLGHVEFGNESTRKYMKPYEPKINEKAFEQAIRKANEKFGI